MPSKESPSESDRSVPIQIGPLTVETPNAPTDVVALQPGRAAPLPELNDENWPKVRGYELLMVIGMGGMGIVYMARQLDLHRTVALKMLRGLGHGDEEYRERLKVEAETVAKIHHPNIIQVYEIGTVEPQHGETYPSPFISFEYVEGGSLMPFTESPQSPTFAASIIEKVARAVHAAHRVGVIHRDLKPANILLTRDKEPKVADFGLAKQFDSRGDSAGRYLTRAGVVMGTPAYMAPEQAADEPLTPAIDTYSLGTILYELLTGRVPFQGASAVETMYLVRDQEPVSPRQLQPKLPRDLETICLKCLQKDISKRYESAEALADDLARWREGRPILARPVGFFERAVRAANRNPAIALLSLLVVLVALAGVSGIVWQWREAVEHSRIAEDAAKKAQEATRAERWERYRSHIVAAANAIQLNNVVAARSALDTAPEEYRNWEWHHFYQQLDGSIAVLHWPGVGTSTAFFSHNRQRLLVQGDAQSGRVWDLVARKEVGTFPPGTIVSFPQLSPDGQYIGYVTARDTYALHDLTTHQSRTLQGLTHPANSHFNADSTRLATYARDGKIRIWDVATGEQRESISFEGRTPSGVGFGPDLERVKINHRDPSAVSLGNLKTNRVVELHGNDFASYGGMFNPDGSRLLTIGAFPDNTFHLWESSTGKPVASFSGHTNQTGGFSFSRDNTRIASGSLDQTARIWEVNTSKAIATLRGHKGSVNTTAFSLDGQRLVTASDDQTLRVWNANDGTPLVVLRGHTQGVVGAIYLADGSTIASSGRDGTVRFWDARQVERNGEIRGHTKFVYSVAFYPDGERVVSASWDGTVRVWNATTGQQLLSRSNADALVVSVAVHPGGHLLATLERKPSGHGDEGIVRLLSAETGDELHHWRVLADWRDGRVAFSAQGDLLAAGNRKGEVLLWDVKSKAVVALLPHGKDVIRDVAFSPDGRWLASGGEDTQKGIGIWDLAHKSELTALQGHTGGIYALTFSRDGKLLASGSTDHTLRLWDTTTWKELAVFPHAANVYSVAFTQDGTRIVSGCADNTIRFWDVKTHREVAELRGHSNYVHSIAFSPDGSRLISGSGDNSLRIWDTLSPTKRTGGK